MTVTLIRPNALYGALRWLASGRYEVVPGTSGECRSIARAWGGADGKRIVVGELLALLDLVVDHASSDVQALLRPARRQSPDVRAPNALSFATTDASGWLFGGNLRDPATLALLAQLAVAQKRLPAAVGKVLIAEAMDLLHATITVH